MIERSLKADKEAFVTGHDGSTPWEILLVCFAVITGSALYGQVAIADEITTMKTKTQSNLRTTSAIMPMKTGTRHSFLQLVLVEAIGVWFPIVLAQSNYLYPFGVIAMIVQIILTIALKQSNRRRLEERQQDQSTTGSNSTTAINSSNDNQNRQPKLEFLTLYRSSIMYLTFVAILEVDFHVFPRRFCKTEISGYGLMDVGAASFCVSAGLVSHRARRRRHRQKQQQQGKSLKSTTTSSYAVLFKPLIHTMPLIIIGFIRAVANQELDYQEHVSEYGVHWNFFFTMGVMAFVPPLFEIVAPSPPNIILPLIIMVVYQWCLINTLSGQDWQSFIEDAPRTCDGESLQLWSTRSNESVNADDVNTNSLTQLILLLPSSLCNFAAANREGILGCLGYLSLYFTGEWIGYHWLWTSNTSTPNDGGSTRSHHHELGWLALVLWGIHFILVHGFGIHVSRRSTNLPFCIWAVAHNVQLLYFLQRLTLWGKNGISSTSTNMDVSLVPIVWETVNSYGLIMFLIANLLTGLVNLTVPTLQINDIPALLIVFLYICILGLAALVLDTIWTKLSPKKKRHETRDETIYFFNHKED